MMGKRVIERRAWAAANGWSYADANTVPADAMTGSFPRPPVVEVTHEMRGHHGPREAFVHDRAPFVGGTQPSQFFRSISGVRVGVSTPMAYVHFRGRRGLLSTLASSNLRLQTYMTPHTVGFEQYRDVLGTRSLLWCQPGGAQYLFDVLGPVLQTPLPRPEGAAAGPRRMMLAIGQGWILACDPLSLGVQADLQRLAIAAAVAERAEAILEG